MAENRGLPDGMWIFKYKSSVRARSDQGGDANFRHRTSYIASIIIVYSFDIDGTTLETTRCLHMATVHDYCNGEANIR